MLAFQDKIKIKKKQYSPNALRNAYKEVESGTSVYAAARNFGVPESTLRDRTLGLVSITGKSENFIFDESTEKQIVEHVEHMASIGYGYSKSDILYLASDLAVSLNKRGKNDKMLSNKWFYSFIKRWPELTTTKPQKLSMIRAKCASKETLSNYYKELGTLMTKNGLRDKPEKIFNIDESALQTEHTPPKIVHNKNVKPQCVTSPRSSNITIIGAGNAIGNAIPPYYVFPGKRFDKSLLQGTPAGADGQCSETGWSNSSIFQTYLETHFLKYVTITDESPVLVLFDGHRSHISLSLLRWAESKNIILFVLPPHCSHLLQPLDIGCFGSFKQAYNTECKNYLRKNPGCNITKFNIGMLSGPAYRKGLSATNLVSAFKKAGIFPFNSHVVDATETAPATIYNQIMDDTIQDDADMTDTQKSDGLDKDDPQPNPMPIMNHAECNQANATNILNSPVVSPSNPNTPEKVSTENDTTSSSLQTTVISKDSRATDFLKKRTIISIKAPEKKRKSSYFSVTGNVGKKKNVEYLKQLEKKSQTKTKRVSFKPPYKVAGFGKVPEPEQNQPNSTKMSKKGKGKKTNKKIKVTEDLQIKNSEVVPSTSGTNTNVGGPLPIDTDTDSDSDDDDTETCCVCDKRSPDGIHQVIGIVFVKWAQCDECKHWTHLQFCCSTRVLRRGDTFLCPHCEH